MLISTDIGGTDPDDNQSMIHLLMYSALFDLEGLVSSPSFGNGSKEEIVRMIDLYAKDYPQLKKHNTALMATLTTHRESRGEETLNLSVIAVGEPSVVRPQNRTPSPYIVSLNGSSRDPRRKTFMKATPALLPPSTANNGQAIISAKACMCYAIVLRLLPNLPIPFPRLSNKSMDYAARLS